MSGWWMVPTLFLLRVGMPLALLLVASHLIDQRLSSTRR